MPSWIFTVLGHWNNISQVNMSLLLVTLFWFQTKQSLTPHSYIQSGKAAKTNFIVSGLTWLWLQTMIYQTGGDYAALAIVSMKVIQINSKWTFIVILENIESARESKRSYSDLKHKKMTFVHFIFFTFKCHRTIIPRLIKPC